MLKIVHLCSGYDSLRVLHGVSLNVKQGEIVALLGANGAGKSTLLKTVAGLLPPMEGRILFQDRNLAGWAAHRMAAAGVALVPEGRGLFPGMTVRDNLRMGLYGRALTGTDIRRRMEQACEAYPDLREKLDQRASELSGGQQQMLALARALISQPRVLLLDEPSTGLAPLLVAEMLKRIQSLKTTGMGIILAEQNVQGALRIADRGYVLKNGRIVLEGPARVLAESEEVRHAYLGK